MVTGVPCPSGPMCVTDRKLSPVGLLKSPPEHQCPLIHLPGAGKRDGDWGNLCPYTPRLTIRACPVGNVCPVGLPPTPTPGVAQGPRLQELVPSSFLALQLLLKLSGKIQLTLPQMR